MQKQILKCRLLKRNITLFSVVFVVILIVNSIDTTVAARPYVSNLSRDCLRCLCHAASGCDLSAPYKCDSEGRCGLFRLTYEQWRDSGRPIPERTGNSGPGSHSRPGTHSGTEAEFGECMADYKCAEQVVIGYMEMHGQDCNGDRVTDCEDYMLINGHGSSLCYRRLNHTSEGREYLQRYRLCRPLEQ